MQKSLYRNGKKSRVLASLVQAVLLISVWGCGSTTHRTATEQLVLSEAIDRAVNQIDFSPLAGTRVFLDTQTIRVAQGRDVIGGDYVASTLRQQLLASGCQLMESREEADLIVEPRIGALASNGHEVIYGVPASNGLSSLSSLASGPPLPAIPELSVGRMNVLSGISKLAVFAYSRETREPVWQSGTSRSEANTRSTWILGAGPFVRGNVFAKTRFAGQNIGRSTPPVAADPDRVMLGNQHVFMNAAEVLKKEETAPPADQQIADGKVPETNESTIR